MQLFTRNQTRWVAKPLSETEIAAFRDLRAETGIGPNMAHASYLMNLATSDPDAAQQSVEAFLDEVRRADQLGIEFLTFHPGSHKGAGLEAGIRLVAERLDRVLEAAEGNRGVMILLENTAGMGATLGAEFSQLRDIIAASRNPGRLGICVDTCHAYGAGYDLVSADGYEAMIEEMASCVTLAKVRAFHLNDSAQALGSRKDRHAGIGQGIMGLAPFERLLRDERFRDRFGCLETPEAEKGYKRELALLRSLLLPGD
jgi:deoxyribonuclease-4